MFVKNVNWDSDIRHLEPLGNSWEVPNCFSTSVNQFI
ncbi:Acyl-coenzyme A thioesterase 8 [Caenorhabditis elegans]|uniref:Acyl-coenzyme A thioesterase 8 n=1 Tax=Caenorhabditis elegans TaxID=6239 RepID=H2KYT8_CAEEL|nr:Acyl-coenzyme A thioesterase 8 [Caenorhabditis elegans]CCD64832.1 Acyl-coenzyme A thioesterase 8 [Caenorhabditis elegans]|eukprot:NP_495077.1 Uncharacterized protein CELE_C17C3.1 [Caenorhabditis elegans]